MGMAIATVNWISFRGFGDDDEGFDVGVDDEGFDDDGDDDGGGGSGENEEGDKWKAELGEGGGMRGVKRECRVDDVELDPTMILGKGSAGSNVTGRFNLAAIGFRVFEVQQPYKAPTKKTSCISPVSTPKKRNAKRNYENCKKRGLEKRGETRNPERTLLTMIDFHASTAPISFLQSTTLRSHNFGFLITLTFLPPLNTTGPNTSSTKS